MNLKGRVAIVTGGASGIGRAIAVEFADRGACVVIGDLDRVRGLVVERELQARSPESLFIKADISDRDETRSLIKQTIARFDALDILVNNAGVNFVKPTLEVTDQEWERVINVDLRGTFVASQSALLHMVQRKKGVIVNICSVHSMATLSGAAPYAAAKAAVAQLTRALAVEFGECGIRINAVSPGAVDTQIWKDAEAAAADKTEFLRHWLAHIPSRRVGHAEEIAKLVAFLASEEASYINGSNFVIDGGMTSMLTASESRDAMHKGD